MKFLKFQTRTLALSITDFFVDGAGRQRWVSHDPATAIRILLFSVFVGVVMGFFTMASSHAVEEIVCMEEYSEFDPVYEDEHMMLGHYLATLDYALVRGLFFHEVSREVVLSSLYRLEETARALRKKLAHCEWK